MAGEPELTIEVVYALADAQDLVRLRVGPDTTAAQAVRLSGLLERHPEIDLATARIGIYGRLVAEDTVVRDQDRVEIYRPLIADPKQARRRRASFRR
jgi:uncharacterized protein